MARCGREGSVAIGCRQVLQHADINDLTQAWMVLGSYYIDLLSRKWAIWHSCGYVCNNLTYVTPHNNNLNDNTTRGWQLGKMDRYITPLPSAK